MEHPAQRVTLLESHLPADATGAVQRERDARRVVRRHRVPIPVPQQHAHPERLPSDPAEQPTATRRAVGRRRLRRKDAKCKRRPFDCNPSQTDVEAEGAGAAAAEAH